MKLIRKLAALGVAAEAARRYAQKNPEQVRKLTDKAATFADQKTKGKYHGQIDSLKRTLAELGGYAAPAAAGGPEPPVTAQAEVTSTKPAVADQAAATESAGPRAADRPTPYQRG